MVAACRKSPATAIPQSSNAFRSAEGEILRKWTSSEGAYSASVNLSWEGQKRAMKRHAQRFACGGLEPWEATLTYVGMLARLDQSKSE